MTPEERAEKILQEMQLDSYFTQAEFKENTEYLAAQIAEAEREAVERTLKEKAGKYMDEEYRKGFAAAKAKAAFLAHQWADNVYNGNGEMQLVKWIRELAAKIEAMEP